MRLPPNEKAGAPRDGTNGVKGFESYRYILGATPQAEMLRLLEFASIDSPSRKKAVLQQWRSAVAAFQKIVAAGDDLPENIAVRPTSKCVAEYAATLQDNRSFRRTFPGTRVSLCEVEIDRLVASQRTISLSYAGECEVPTGERGIAEYCLNPRAPAAPVDFVYNKNGLTFTSLDPGLAVLHTGKGVTSLRSAPNASAPGRPAYAVTTYIGFGTSTAFAFRIGERLILANGYHRLFALRTAGVAAAPIAVVEVNYPELELSDRLIQFPAAYLVTAPRPPLFKDLFDNRLTADLRLRRKATAVSIEISHEPHAIPAP